MDNDNESLDYVSSLDVFAPEKGKSSVDATDEKALVRLVRVMDSQIKLYHTITGMRQFDDKKFNADEREALCVQYVMLLSALKQLITNAIDGVKEARNG